MKFKILTNKNLLAYLLFLAIFLFGIFSFKDYGISIDEAFHRENGSFYYKYVKSFIQGPNSLSTINAEKIIQKNIDSGGSLVISPSVQPAIFDLFCEFLIEKFDIKNSKNIYELRHFINFIFFFIGLYFFYKLIIKRFNSNIYALTGVLFLFLSPRFLAESFYNQKDIFFLVLTIINMYAGINFLEKPNFKNTLLFSISSALAFDVRIMGIISIFIIIFLFVIKSLRNNYFLKKNLKFIIYFFPITFLFIILFWPYLWRDPINNFLYVFSELLSINFGITSLYMGEFILSGNAPWHYPLVWIGITSPIAVILFFLIGLLFLFKRIFTRLIRLNDDLNDIWRGEKEMFDIYFLLIILIPIFIFINKGLADYDGWRHLYFIYPSIIMISLFGIYYLKLYLKSKLFIIIVNLVIVFNLTYLVLWNYKFHPNQYTYFNILFKNHFDNNFEKDYWGISNIQSINHIIKNAKVYPVVVATKSFTSLPSSLLMLNEEDKEKISITYNLSEAEFIMTNYRIKHKNDFFIDKNKYKKYYEITVDNVPINTVYRKIE